MKIYISPANHYKPYVISGYTEKVQMEGVAKRVVELLSAYNCEVIYPTVFNTDRQYTGRPQEAKRWGADVYIAIHSNAAGTMGAYATGAEGYYHKGSLVSKALAEKLQTSLDAACPIASNRSRHIIDGMTMYNGAGLGEIREPYHLGMVPCLIETNFHSYKPTAEWIINNIELIAQIITESIAAVLNLEDKMTNEKIIELENKIAALESRAAELEAKSNEFVFAWVDENMPEWARPTVQKLMDKGYLKGDAEGKLNLEASELRILVVLDRAGAFRE